MNVKTLQKVLKECNCGIEFQKDKRKEYKGRYYLDAWPTAACGSGCFVFQDNRFFITEPTDYDRPRFETREVTEQEFIKEVLDFLVYDNERYNIRKKNSDAYIKLQTLLEQHIEEGK